MNTYTAQHTPVTPAPQITTVAGYLLTRLAEAGLASVFGVPGDDNLAILDAVAARPELAWIGMATEQGPAAPPTATPGCVGLAPWSPRSAPASCPR